MKITINKSLNQYNHESKKPAESALDNRIGLWGVVKAVCSKDNTADVVLENGLFLTSVPVASKEWVVIPSEEDAEKGRSSGERDLPPVNARVFVFMPTHTFSDCFIAPFSSFITIDRNASAPFMEDDKEKIKERITPSGWHMTNGYVAGSYKAVSPDGKTSFEIDYGNEEEPKEENPELHINLFNNIKADVTAEDNVSISVFDEVTIDHVKEDSCTIKVFDTELVIKRGEVSIKTKKINIEVDGDATLKTSGKTTIEATGDTVVKGAKVDVEASQSAKVKAPQVQITGGSLQVNGNVAPATGPFTCLPNCLFTGAPHGGNVVANT